mgnify:CR=1 FL=1
MDLYTWIDAERGRMSAMAAHFGISVAAVSQWRTTGIPVDRMKAVRDYTGGQVTLEEMIPEPHSAAPASLPNVAGVRAYSTRRGVA